MKQRNINTKNIASTRLTQPLGQGAWEVDQQWIVSGVKQCSRHLNKKISLPINLFLEQTKSNIDQIPKNITYLFFWKLSPKVALSNYGI